MWTARGLGLRSASISLRLLLLQRRGVSQKSEILRAGDCLRNLQTPGSGFLVPYLIRPTPGGGLGVFAAAPIPRGTCVWTHEAGRVAEYTEKETANLLAHLGGLQAADWLKRTLVWQGRLVQPLDDARFLQGSDAVGNLRASPDQAAGPCAHAVRDIDVGEELLKDDNPLEIPTWFHSLCERYGRR